MDICISKVVYLEPLKIKHQTGLFEVRSGGSLHFSVWIWNDLKPRSSTSSGLYDDIKCEALHLFSASGCSV